jgi:hypothetical protein
MWASQRRECSSVHSNRGTVFSVRSMSAGKNVSTEAEDIVGIRHQAMISEDTADCSELQSV